LHFCVLQFSNWLMPPPIALSLPTQQSYLPIDLPTPQALGKVKNSQSYWIFVFCNSFCCCSFKILSIASFIWFYIWYFLFGIILVIVAYIWQTAQATKNKLCFQVMHKHFIMLLLVLVQVLIWCFLGFNSVSVASSKRTAQATANKTINLVRHVCFVIVLLTLPQISFFSFFAATSPNSHLLPLS